MKHRLLALFALLCLAVSLTVPAGAVEYAGFSDVDGSANYAEAIQWAAEQGYISGYPGGTNVPKMRTRACPDRKVFLMRCLLFALSCQSVLSSCRQTD